ncbi:MAG: hypothetical protein Q9169_004171 [Polycauliona sp. 2 TL-2023]
MHYNFLALLCLSTPLLSQAGPAQSISHHSSGLGLRTSDPGPAVLITRAEDKECNGAEECKSTGQKLWDALQAKLNDDNAQDVTAYDDLFQSEYDDPPTRDTSPNANSWRDLFHKLSYDYKEAFAEHPVTSKTEGSKLSYFNSFNTNEGTMISAYNYKDSEYDKTPDDKKVPVSEIIFQCYSKECDDIKELKKFKFGGVYNIINKVFLRVIDEIYDATGRNKGIKSTWEKFTFEENKDEFLALLGTPSIGRFARMLTDHSVAFDNRLPTEIWTNYRPKDVYVVIDKYKK